MWQGRPRLKWISWISKVVVDVNGWTKGSFGSSFVASMLDCMFSELIERKAIWGQNTSPIESEVIFLL